MPVKRGHGGGGGGGHDAAGGMRWLLTYSDLITLLLIMFILLYSAATQDVSRFKDMAQYMRAAFGGVLQQGPTFLQGQGDRIIPDLVQRMAAAVEPDGKGGGGQAPQVFKNERGIVVRLMTDNVLYDSGSAEIGPAMREILDAVSAPIKEAKLPVLVEGHTDDLPVRGGKRYADNMELSAMRAAKVVRYLIEAGKVPPELLSAVGYAQYRPVAPNSTSENRKRNRRIDIVILEGSGPSAK
jgi:chemotaxis protein MotB